MKQGDLVRVIAGFNKGFIGKLGLWNHKGFWPIISPRTTCWARPQNLVVLSRKDHSIRLQQFTKEPECFLV